MIDNLGNQISPDQENVYYSPNSLIKVMQGLIPNDKREILEETLKSYDRGVFVLDSNNLNYIIINVYQQPFLSTPVSSIVITPNSVSASATPAVAPAQTPIPSDSVDRAVSIEMKQSFHSNNNIKETTYDPNPNSKFVHEASRNIDVIASVKNWHDDKVMNEKLVNAKILLNLVKDKLQNIPYKTLEKYVKEYSQVEEEIDELIEVMQDTANVQSKTIALLNVERFLREFYKITEIIPEFDQSKIRVLVQQAIFDLFNVDNHMKSGGSNKRRGMSENGQILFDTKTTPLTGGTIDKAELGLKAAWSSIAGLDDESMEAPAISEELEAGSYISNMILQNGTDVFGEDGALNFWFVNNVYKKLAGQSLSFSGLETYLETFSQKTNEATQYFKENGGFGAELILEQAVYRAIEDLCASNVDVSSYSAKSGTTTKFSLYNTSGVLGPKKIFPYPRPSPQEEAKEEEKAIFQIGNVQLEALVAPMWNVNAAMDRVEASDSVVTSSVTSRSASSEKTTCYEFSNNKFINLQIIIKDLQTILSKQMVKEWMAQNLTSVTTSPRIIAKEIVHSYSRPPTSTGDAEWTGHLRRAYHTWQNGKVLKGKKGSYHWVITESSGNTDKGFLQDKVPQTGIPNSSHYNLFHKRSSVAYVTKQVQDQREPEPVLGINLWGDQHWAKDMGLSGAETVADEGLLNFGWGSNDKTEYNISDFYEKKGYNLPHLMNVSLSLVRAIVHKTIENLIEAYKEISNRDLILSAVEIINNMTYDDSVLFLESILSVVNNLEPEDVGIQIYLNYDATKSILTTFPNSAGGETTRNDTLSKNAYKDTVYSDSLGPLCKEYIEFQGRISSHFSIKIVDSPDTKAIFPRSLIPLEALATDANPNYKNSWGSSSQYLRESEIQNKYDPMQFTVGELTSTEFMKKKFISTSKDKGSFSWPGCERFVKRFSPYFQHIQMLVEIPRLLEQFQDSIERVEPKNKVMKLFENGVLDNSFRVDNPQATIRQIAGRRNRYRANSDGISRRFVKALKNLPDPNNNKVDHIYVLAVTADFFGDEQVVTVAPRFNPINAQYADGKEEGGNGTGSVIDGQGVRVSRNPAPENEEWLNYLHIYRGIDIGLHSLGSNQNLIYSKEIQKNDAGIFGWTKDDFDEDGVPTRSLETIWSLSPWLFPRNYFYDVVDSGKYYKIFVGTLSNVDKLQIPYTAGMSHVDLIGSTQWEITE